MENRANYLPPPRPPQPPWQWLQMNNDCGAYLKAFAIVIALYSLVGSVSTHRTLAFIHGIPNGHVGLYWTGGVLRETLAAPGLKMKMPLLTRYEPVQLALHTDLVRDIPCNTKGDVMIYFERIDVINHMQEDFAYNIVLEYGINYDVTLIHNKIRDAINQFCNSHTFQEVYFDVFDQIGERMKDALMADYKRNNATGIEIISVHVSKPKIPESIKRKFEQMEEESLQVLIDAERQKVIEKDAETLKNMEIWEAEKIDIERNSLTEQKLMKKKRIRKLQELEDEMYIARQKTKADAAYYREKIKVEAMKLKLAPEFLQQKFTEAITQNTKISSGDYVTNYIVLDQRLLENVLERLFSWNTTVEEGKQKNELNG